MKFRIALLAALAASAFAGASQAATLGDLVIKGPMADRINEKNELTAAVAEKIVKHCIDEAATHNLPAAAVVLDQFGTIIYYYRADGLAKGATESALKKAQTAFITRAPSHALQNRVTLGTATDASAYIQGEFPVAGGLPIVVDHEFLGVIGVGGMPSTPPTWSDEICGYNALTAVIGPQPPLLDYPQRPGAAPPTPAR